AASLVEDGEPEVVERSSAAPNLERSSEAPLGIGPAARGELRGAELLASVGVARRDSERRLEKADHLIAGVLGIHEAEELREAEARVVVAPVERERLPELRLDDHRLGRLRIATAADEFRVRGARLARRLERSGSDLDLLLLLGDLERVDSERRRRVDR